MRGADQGVERMQGSLIPAEQKVQGEEGPGGPGDPGDAGQEAQGHGDEEDAGRQGQDLGGRSHGGGGAAGAVVHDHLGQLQDGHQGSDMVCPRFGVSTAMMR